MSPRAIDPVEPLRRAAARLLLAAATLGFGAAGWLAVVHQRWQALVGLVLWAIVGGAAFRAIWKEDR